MTIGFALCGSFCTYSRVFPVMERLAKDFDILPIFSQSAYDTDSRFGTAAEHIARAEAICNRPPLHTLTEVEPIGPKRLLDALIIGLCQSVATIPGLSRSGTTITAGIATGLRRDYAVKFSFLMSLPAVLGANLLSLVKAVGEGVDWASVPAYLVGMLVAMVSGIASISLLKYISVKGRFGGFAYYCWVMGVLSIVLSMIF